MTLVLDASAIVALLTDEPAAAEVTDLLGAESSVVSSVNTAEVVDRLARVGGLDLDIVTGALDELAEAGLVVEAADAGMAMSAGRVRAERYDRSVAELSLADCFALATAATQGRTLVTSDAVLCRTAAELAIATHPLPNSSGQRYQPTR